MTRSAWAKAVALVCLAASLTAVGAVAHPSVARAAVVTSAQLIEQNKKFNGKTITYRGEVIGDILYRGNYAWLSVNDDAYQSLSVEEGHELSGYNSGQAIWVPSYLVKGITYLGRYTESGDKIEVTGVFNSACPEHGGDMDIHAASLGVVKSGHAIPHPFDFKKALGAAILLLVGGLLFALNRRVEMRKV